MTHAGSSRTKKNTKLIIDGLKAEQYINCVCLVINGRLSRITATLRYVLTEVTSILPREVLSNVIVVFTKRQSIRGFSILTLTPLKNTLEERLTLKKFFA